LTNFRNEIVWSYKRYTAKSNHFQRLHDIILFYGKSDQTVFNEPREEYGLKSGKADSHYKQDEDGAWYRWQKRRGQEPYKIYLSPEGRRLGDVWELAPINASAKERIGYPTQKPEVLLERIIKASTNAGDVVLDPFCGCGTAIAVAERLKLNWIGIDITHLAMNLIKNRLNDMTIGKAKYTVIGEPVTLPDAEELATNDKYQFQWWALGLVGARPADQKKGADKGIDGRLYFHDEADETKTKQIILSVKGGKLKPDDIRALSGVVEREKAQIGVLISFEKPTKSMKADAAGNFYHSPAYNQDYPALQIITVEELLGGKRIDMPPQQQVSITFKKAPIAKDPQGHNLRML